MALQGEGIPRTREARFLVAGLSLAFLLAPLAPAQGGPVSIACDTPLPGLPCNLRATFAPNEGNENFIAINPANPDNLIITTKDYGLTGNPGVPNCAAINVWTGFYATLDGGLTWTNGFAPGFPGSGVTNAISKYRCSTDPVVAFDNAGTAYLSGLALDAANLEDTLWVAKSTDGGLTWPELEAADTADFNDKNWVAVDPDNSNVYVTWTKFDGNNGIFFRRALDGEIAAWDARVKLSGASSGAAQGSFPVVGPDGTIYVLWNNNANGGAGNIFLVESHDEGAAWTAERAILATTGVPFEDGAPYRTPTLIQAAVDRSTSASRGNLYVVWQDRRHGDSDAFFARSTDGGGTWSAPLRLNEDAVGNGVGQNFPAIAVDPTNGWVHVAWYDRRHDPGNDDFVLYARTSRDGGLTWSPEQRVGTHINDPAPCRHQNGFTFIGDYLGIAAHAGKVRPAFVDTRNDRCDLYTAHLFAPPSLAGDVRPHLNVTVPEDVVLDVGVWDALGAATLEFDVPDHWTIEDADGGVIVPSGNLQTLGWDLGAPSEPTSRTVRVTPTVATVVDLEARLDWTLTPAGSDVVSSSSSWAQTVLVSYPVLAVDLAVPDRIARSNVFNVTVDASNVGFGDAAPVAILLSYPDGFTPLPKSAVVTLEPPGAGLQYGSPRSDPETLPDGPLRWSFDALEPQTRLSIKVAFLSPHQGTGDVTFGATLIGTAPDGALLVRTDAATARLRGGSLQDTQGGVAALLDHLTSP